MEEKQPEQSVSSQVPPSQPTSEQPVDSQPDRIQDVQPAKPTHPNYLGKFRKLLHFRKFEDGTLAPTTGKYIKDENGSIRRIG